MSVSSFIAVLSKTLVTQFVGSEIGGSWTESSGLQMGESPKKSQQTGLFQSWEAALSCFEHHIFGDLVVNQIPSQRETLRR